MANAKRGKVPGSRTAGPGSPRPARDTSMQAPIPDAASVFSVLFALSPYIMAFFDARFTLTAANGSFARQVGLPLAQVLGSPGEELIPDWWRKVGQICREIRESGKPFSSEAYLVESKAETGWETAYWDMSISPVSASGGGVQGYLLLGHDVTKRELAERELREKERHYRRIVETASEGVWMVDAYSKTTFVNGGMAEMLGYVPVEMIGQSLFAFMDEESRAIAAAGIKRRRGEVKQQYDFRFVRKDGSDLWAIVSTTPILDREGRYAGALGMITDITERKRIEREREEILEANSQLAARAAAQAEEAEHRAAEFKAVLESMAEGVAVMDATGRFLLANQAVEKIAGLPGGHGGTADIYSSLGVKVLRRDGTPLPPEEWAKNRVMRGERVTDQEITLVRPDGSKRQIVTNGSPVMGEDGQTKLGIFLLRDVTELRQLERLRQEQISLISHDLRNPLTAIQGHAQALQGALKKAGASERALRNAEFILVSARRMNMMIQDLLDSARLESGALHLDKRPAALRELLHELLQRESPVAGWERVTVDFPEDVFKVNADPARLERILVNLVSNALTYSSPECEVVVRAERMGEELIISVTDHGVGIAAQDLPHVFERFHKFKGAHKAGGVGLGLYITRLLVEAHGGRIWAESRAGEGSTFCFTLPLT